MNFKKRSDTRSAFIERRRAMRWWILLFVAVMMSFANQRLSPSVDVPEKKRSSETLLFEELFEDTNWTSRGWYDNPKMEITSSEHIPGSGHSCVWHWKKAGDIGVAGRGGRVLFKPVTNIILSFYIKHSANWKWTGVNWHPHEFHFITTVDPPFIGPAHED